MKSAAQTAKPPPGQGLLRLLARNFAPWITVQQSGHGGAAQIQLAAQLVERRSLHQQRPDAVPSITRRHSAR